MTVAPRPNGSAAVHGDPHVGHAEPIVASTDKETVARPRVKKAPSAFRTISEVADDLHIPQHVLRFWETKFPQVRPLKRGGGRRYYRPDDIVLLRRISDLLYIQGFTIKGVQRLLREGGGRLSDDIPPPTGDERRDLEAASTEPELPLPGLLQAEEQAGRPRRPSPPPRRGEAGSDREVADGVAGDAAAAEVIRLRRLLSETLAELEALRALLA